MLASLVFFERLPAADFAILHPVNGVAITTGNFVRWPDDKDLPLAERVQEFVRQTRERYPLKRETNLPLPVLLLAAVKFRTPVPPEFWRAAIFGPAPAPPAQSPRATT